MRMAVVCLSLLHAICPSCAQEPAQENHLVALELWMGMAAGLVVICGVAICLVVAQERAKARVAQTVAVEPYDKEDGNGKPETV